MQEHQRDIVTQKGEFKAYNHVNDTGHGFDFDNFKVTNNCSHYKVCLRLESIHTHVQSNLINRSLILNNMYRPIHAHKVLILVH